MCPSSSSSSLLSASSMRTLFLSALLAALFLLVSAPSPAEAQNFQLNVLYTSDVRGRMLPIQLKFGSECTVAQAELNDTNAGNDCFGGVARRAKFIQDFRAANPNTIAVDIANVFFGTSIAAIAQPQASNIGKWMSDATYDVQGLGTNEFFNGPGMLAGYMSGIVAGRPAMVVSNLNVSTEPLLTSNAGAGLQPYTVLTVAGQKIGIVGAIHTEVVSKASPGVNVKVLDPVTSLKAAMVELRAAHPDCNITILVASLSADHLRAVAAAVPGLDLILFRENSDDVNPLVQMSRLPGPNNGEVLVATLPDVGGASDYGGSFAKLVVNFDANGALLSGATWKQMDLGVLGSEDPAVWASVKTDVAKVLQYNGVVVGQLTGQYGEESNNGAYPQLWCRAADCNLGRLYTDAMLYWCKDCDMSHTNAGSFGANLYRSPLSPNVTRDDIGQVLSGFSDSLSTYSILGKDFLATVINYALSKYKAGGFNQFGNVRLAWNSTTSVVSAVYIKNRATDTWAPLDPARMYKAVTVNFLLPPNNGGRKLDKGDKPIGPTLGINLFGPAAVDALATWVGAPTYKEPPTLAQLASCANQSYVLQDTTGSGDITWPTDYCNMIQTAATVDLASACPTNQGVCTSQTMAYEGKPFNQGGCSTCSGLGICIKGYRRCACDGPTTSGLFEGIQMIRGNDCSEVRTETAPSPVLKGFLYATSAISAILAVCVSFFFGLYRNSKIIKRAAHSFLQVACVGALLGSGAAFAITAETTDASCEASRWIGNIGFVLLFGALFVKTWRLESIFRSTKLKPIVLTDMDMMVRLGAFLAVEVLLRGIEVGVSPVHKTARALDTSSETPSVQELLDGTASANSGDFSYTLTCGGSHYQAFQAVGYAYKGVVTLWGCMLAYRVKDITEEFNESRTLAAVIYNMAVLGSIAIVMVEFLQKAQPQIALAITVLAINAILWFTLLALAYPKWIAINKGGGDGAKNLVTKMQSVQSEGAGGDASSPATNYADNTTKRSLYITAPPQDGGRSLKPLGPQAQALLASCTALRARLQSEGANNGGSVPPVGDVNVALQALLDQSEELANSVAGAARSDTRTGAGLLHPSPTASGGALTGHVRSSPGKSSRQTTLMHRGLSGRLVLPGQSPTIGSVSVQMPGTPDAAGDAVAHAHAPFGRADSRSTVEMGAPNVSGATSGGTPPGSHAANGVEVQHTPLEAFVVHADPQADENA